MAASDGNALQSLLTDLGVAFEEADVPYMAREGSSADYCPADVQFFDQDTYGPLGAKTDLVTAENPWSSLNVQYPASQTAPVTSGDAFLEQLSRALTGLQQSHSAAPQASSAADAEAATTAPQPPATVELPFLEVLEEALAARRGAAQQRRDDAAAKGVEAAEAAAAPGPAAAAAEAKAAADGGAEAGKSADDAEDDGEEAGGEKKKRRRRRRKPKRERRDEAYWKNRPDPTACMIVPITAEEAEEADDHSDAPPQLELNESPTAPLEAAFPTQPSLPMSLSVLNAANA